MRKPTKRQALEIERALNLPKTGLRDCWIGEDGFLYVAGRGNGVTVPRCRTWQEAEDLLRKIRLGEITA